MKDDSDIPEGYLKDHRGRLCPKRMVRPERLIEDELARAITDSALSVREHLRSFRADALSEVSAFQEMLADGFGVKSGGKGNVTISTFDGQRQVKVAVQEYLNFGPEMASAKALVDECIEEWSTDSNAALKMLVKAAFDLDEAGRVDVRRVLSLLRHNIEDERWARAMDILTKSVFVASTKIYIRCYFRTGPDQKWEHISLNLANA